LDQHDGDVESATEELLTIAMLEQEKIERKTTSSGKVTPSAKESKVVEPKTKVVEAKVEEVKVNETKVIPTGPKKETLEPLQVSTQSIAKQLLPTPTPAPFSISIPVSSNMDAESKKRFKEELEKALRNGPMPGIIHNSASGAPKAGPVPDTDKPETSLQHHARPKIAQKRGKINLKFKGPPTESVPADSPMEDDELPPHVEMEFDVVETSKFTLEATPDWILSATGQTIQVKWEAHADTLTTNRDWIGLYRLDSSDRYENDDRPPCPSDSFVSWNWTGGGTKDTNGQPLMKGTLTFVPPCISGRYVCQYYTMTNKSGDYSCTAISNPILVGPRFSIKASISQSSTSMPAKIIVDCQQVSSQNKFASGAWLGVYRDDKDGGISSHLDTKNYHAFEWLSNGKDVTPAPPKAESLTVVEKELSFEVPKAGPWHFRLFADRSYIDVASGSIHIPGEDKLNLSVSGPEMKVDCYITTVDPLRDYVWVGIYKIDEKDQRQYRRYKYLPLITSSSPSAQVPHSTLIFKTPIHSGVYEARLFANKTYEVITRSESITIYGI
jgi:hypothetical protein